MERHDCRAGGEDRKVRRCWGKNIVSIQIIYVGNSEFGMYNSHTLKDNKDLLKEQLPVFLFGQLFAYQLNARGEI